MRADKSLFPRYGKWGIRINQYLKMNTKYIKHITLLFSILMVPIITSYAQSASDFCNIPSSEMNDFDNKNGSCNTDLQGDYVFYSDLDTYISNYDTEPLHNPPMKTIKLNFNVFQKDDGTGNFPDNQNTRDILNQMIQSVNTIYEVCAPTDPITGVTEITHTNIEFSIGDAGSERIYFYQNSQIWNSSSPTILLAEVLDEDPDRAECINILLSGNDLYNYAQATMPSYIDLDKDQLVLMHNWGCNFNNGKVNQLAHELGHNLGMLHTYEGGGASADCTNSDEYLTDIFGTWPGNCPHICDWDTDPDASTTDKITNNLMGGNKINCYISPKQSGQMHRALALTSARRFVEDVISDEPLVIDSDETWDFDIRLYRDVIVESGYELTIECNVLMPMNGKVIVERGGKLVLDGGLLTNACDDLWRGIQVYGNSTQSQTYANQGVVEIINGGTIENAVCGIETIKYNDIQQSLPNYSYTGGIVAINNGILKNNKTAIKFWQYTYDNSVSLIGNCQFIADDNLITGIDPDYFVKLNDIDGVRVISSSFTDNRSGISTTDLVTGINCYDAYIDVFQGCEFTGLNYGIHATASTTATNIEIKDSEFVDNYRGIYIGGMTDPRVTSNIFELKYIYSLFTDGYGLYLDESTDYWVEDNTFNKSSSITDPDPVGLGIVVNESGGDPNEIYLNVFNDVENAINVQGNNRDGSNGNIGLVIKCNDYNNTEADETIIWSGRILTTAGIAELQGENTLIAKDMAGNIFHVPDGPVDGDFDDLNNQANDFEYYFSTNAGTTKVEPKDATWSTVDEYGKPTNYWSLETACESTIHISGGGTGDDLSKMSSAQSGIESTETILAALVDGGDTEGLNTEVENSTPPETITVYNELMDNSPNLSETVVESTIEKEEVLPNAMVRDVMVANPHTAKSHVLMDKLDERLDPMPEYMKAQILAGKSIQTLKQELEAQLAGYQMDKAKAMNNIIRYYKKEETDPTVAYTELVNLYQEDNTVKSSYMLAWLYLEKGEYQLGSSVISNIPAQFNLTEEQQLVYEGMGDIYSMLSGLYQNGNTLEDLNETQLTQLQYLAASDVLSTRAYARNILVAIDELEYEEPVLHVDLSKSQQLMEDFEKLMSTKAPQMLSVYPNPSTNYIILEYNLEVEKEASLEIKDMNGKSIRTINTSQKQDQVTVTTEDWKPGLYIATLKINGKSIESVKFTVVK